MVRFPTLKRYYDGLSDQWCEIGTKKIPVSFQIKLDVTNSNTSAGTTNGTANVQNYADINDNTCTPAALITKGTLAEALVVFSRAVVQDYATGSTPEQIISRGRDHYGSILGKYPGLKL